MNDYPLSPFLASLAADGIHLTVRDYERIHLTLQTEGAWTLLQLRDMLMALLVKDEEQQEIFLRRFQAFFKLEPGMEETFAHIDPHRALADLKQLSQEPKSVSQQPETGQLADATPKPTRRHYFQLAWWHVVGFLLVVGMGLALWYAFRPVPPPPHQLGISHIAVNFGDKFPDYEIRSHEIVVTNDGIYPLDLDISLSGLHKDDFGWEYDVSHLLEPSESRPIIITFAPDDEVTGHRAAFLEITYEGQTSQQQIALSGRGREAERIVDERTRLYSNIPYVANISYEPLGFASRWQSYAGMSIFLICAVLLYSLYLWRSHQIPQDKAAYWDERGSRHFPLGSIGGSPRQRLNDDSLNQMADSMGYFRSRHSSKVLNVTASLEATLRNGGMTALEYYKRKEVRSLLILEDVFAEAARWNGIAQELAQGMAERGVPVLYGRFHGSPQQFKTDDGSIYHLEDLEDQRQGYLVLLFTDGQGLYRHESNFTLEVLARWPMVAWMELREPCFWDETVALPMGYGIPVYEATAAGTVKAVRHFLTEQGTRDDFKQLPFLRQDPPTNNNGQFGVYLEQLLGDAFLWAADCSMLQPITLGLADRLRRKFYPHLPAERIERLYRLPGTQHNVSGLRFTDEVLKVLRQAFFVRRDEVAQEGILRFFLQAIEQAEPGESDSLAHLAWEVSRERLLLELQPDSDLKRLAELAQTPLGPSIAASLENYGFQGETNKIPLRRKPRKQEALQRLARITDSGLAHSLETIPIARKHWIGLGLLALVSLGLSSLSLRNYFTQTDLPVNLTVEEPSANGDFTASLEIFEDGSWQQERYDSVTSLFSSSGLRKGFDHRLTLHKEGLATTQLITTTANIETVAISMGARDVEVPCREEDPEIGLVIKVCAETQRGNSQLVQRASWYERLGEDVPRNRILSVGLEIATIGENNTRLRQWHDLLLDTGSVDILYRIEPNDEGEWHIDAALERIAFDLASQREQGQLIWWTMGQTLELRGQLPSFDRTLKLGEGMDLSWVSDLTSLFGETPLHESDIAAVLDTAASGDGVPIVLGKQQSALSLAQCLEMAPISIVSSQHEGVTFASGDVISLARERTTFSVFVDTSNCSGVNIPSSYQYGASQGRVEEIVGGDPIEMIYLSPDSSEADSINLSFSWSLADVERNVSIPLSFASDCTLPTVSIVTLDSLDEVFPDSQIRFGFDASGGNLSSQWSASQGTISGGGNSVIYTAPASPGEDIVSVEIRNDCGSSNDTISIEIVVPPTTQTPLRTATPTPTMTAMSTGAIAEFFTACGLQAPVGWSLYRVQPGDTIISILLANTGSMDSDSIAEVVQVNCLSDARLLFIGQQIFIPTFLNTTPTEAAAATPTVTSTARPTFTSTPPPTQIPTITPTPMPTSTPSPSPTATLDHCIVAVLNFETDASGSTLFAGHIVSDEWADCGIHVSTQDSINFPPMIFDSSNPPINERDLGTPNEDFGGPGRGLAGQAGEPGQNQFAQGNILTISDGDPFNPNDNGNGGTFIFTFDQAMCISFVRLIDIDHDNDGQPVIAFGENNEILNSVSMIGLGDNSIQTVPVDTNDVYRLEIKLVDSGALASIGFCS